MGDNARESYDIRNSINELHVLDVINQVLSRHLSSEGQSTTSPEYEKELSKKRIACLRFALDMQTEK